MKTFTHGSLFSGIGGFDLASEWMGWDNKFHCEWNEFGRKILNYYWPESKSYGDITQSDFTIWRGKIDILTGGFPCQPYSQAGKRLGKEDDRHLWPEMLRAIREIRPPWVVGENVYGLVNWSGGLVFEEVQADLEAEGYEVQPVIIPACGVGAPHKRERIWFVAHNPNARIESMRSGGENSIYESRTTPNPGSKQLQERAPERNRENKEKEGSGMDNRTERSGNFRDATDTNKLNGNISGLRTGKASQFEASGVRGNITSNSIGQRQRGESDRIRESRFFNENGEIPNWEDFPTQSPIRWGNDGISDRMDIETVLETVGRKVNSRFKADGWWRQESIKAYGNAIVPQVAYEIFKAIKQTDLFE